ncbi:Hypothetical protein, putative [Bodo saltans]|uniref:Uncharacterized protein n=1 Tax=Bodo saltans TaxID=75058 RepID=A0A0S4ILM8_BODSA|nr:Hypothetical protein, putative [Bodo saltans]|eukprot:CUE58789.1 Hypothetical protein, putative [Bodo saltans]
MRRAGSLALVAAQLQAVRCVSDAHTNIAAYPERWAAPNQEPERPNTVANHPHRKFRKTSVEWRLHHKNGVRYGNLGPTREIADFEYADGTPAPMSGKRFALKHHQDGLLVQLIRAGATVEKSAASGYLPRIPGVPEQRNWDPEIPLFLEDADEHGKAPTQHYESSVAARHLNSKFAGAESSSRGGSPSAVNRHAGETLEPITMFASYDAASFINEPVRTMEARKPIWSRRRWALSDEFLVPKSPQPKNTIKDE